MKLREPWDKLVHLDVDLHQAKEDKAHLLVTIKVVSHNPVWAEVKIQEWWIEEVILVAIQGWTITWEVAEECLPLIWAEVETLQVIILCNRDSEL